MYSYFVPDPQVLNKHNPAAKKRTMTQKKKNLTLESLHTTKHRSPYLCLVTLNLPRSNVSPLIWYSVVILNQGQLDLPGDFCKDILCDNQR